jgi:hypothetical protein
MDYFWLARNWGAIPQTLMIHCGFCFGVAGLRHRFPIPAVEPGVTPPVIFRTEVNADLHAAIFLPGPTPPEQKI